VAEIEVFSELKSASTPKHTTHKKSHCDEWLFYLLKCQKFSLRQPEPNR
jgi:hypothetical protein